MPDHHNALRRFERTTTTLLGVVVPIVLICVVLLVALLPDEGSTLTWNERSRIIHPWGR